MTEEELKEFILKKSLELVKPEIQIIDDLDKKKQKLIKEWKETYNSECFHCGALGVACRGALKQESIDYCKENKLYDLVNNDMVEYSIEHLL